LLSWLKQPKRLLTSKLQIQYINQKELALNLWADSFYILNKRLQILWKI